MKKQVQLLIPILTISLAMQAQLTLPYADVAARNVTTKSNINFKKTATLGYTITYNDITTPELRQNLTLKIGADTLQPLAIVSDPIQKAWELKDHLTDTAPSLTIHVFDKTTLAGTITLTNTNGATPAVRTTATTTLSYDDYIKKTYGLKLRSGVYKYYRNRNVILEKNIIHLFMDEDGNFHIAGLPTTVRADNLIVIHLLYKTAEASFKCNFEGTYDPAFEVYGAGDKTAEANATEAVTIHEKIFAPQGPYTGTVKITITRTTPDTATILDKTIAIAALHKITLNAGMYASFLTDPQNITTYAKPNGDTTLIADNPKSRGFVTIMLSFYPWPRNILFPSTDWKERIGFTVGTSVNKNLADNFFAGVSYDIAMGLGITAGAHYGTRNVITGYKHFKFSNDPFTGDPALLTKKAWGIGVFVGLNIDFRLLSYIFKSTGT